MEQRTSEWHEARRGMVTASCFADACTKGRGKEFSKTAESLLYALLAEHLTGEVRTPVRAKALDWGTEYEEEAIAAYEFSTGNLVTSEGFLLHPLEPMIGGSPDGLVGEEGLIEVKCPYNSQVHVKTMVTREIPSEYIPQVDGNMWVTGRDWCDFISYDPRLSKHSLVVIRRERDEAAIRKLASQVCRFRDRLQELLDEYGVVE